MAILPCFHTGYLGFGACCKVAQLRSRQQFNAARSGTVRLFLLPLLPSTEHTWEKNDSNTSITTYCSFSEKGDACPTLCILRWDLSKGIKQGSVILDMVFPRAACCLGSYRYLSSGSVWAASLHGQVVLCEQEGELDIQRHGERCEGNHPNSTDNMR